MPPTMPPKSWAVNALVGTPRNEKPAYSLGETRVSVLHGIAWNQFLAVAVRFELTNGLTRRQFSRLVPSTTRPRFLSVQHYTYIIARRQLPGPHSAKFTAQRHRFPANSGGLLGLDRYPVVAQARSNSMAGSGREYRYPCTSSQPERFRKASCSSVSTPSAITLCLSCWAMLMMVLAMAQSLASPGMPVVNERSIFSVSIGKRFR